MLAFALAFIPFILLALILPRLSEKREREYHNELQIPVTLKHQRAENTESLQKIHTRCDPDDYFNTSWKIYDAGMSSNSLSNVEVQLKKLEGHLAYAEQYGKHSAASAIQDDIRDLRDHMKELEYEKWEDKTYDLLSEFSSLYTDVVSEDEVSFSDLESILAAERECLRLYDKYWKHYHESNLSIDPAEYMKQQLGCDFHSCMLSREALSAELSAHTDRIRAEYKRKMRLCKAVLSSIGQEPIQRSKLLNQVFPNADKKEVACCYKKLVHDGRIVESKVGNYWFASLSDKEKSTAAASTKKAPRPAVTFDDLIAQLTQKGISFKDMRSSGGCLWIESTGRADALLKGISVDGFNPVVIPESRHFSGRRAWYIKGQ